MTNDPTTTPSGPWRMLILDPDREDPKWVIARVEGPDDVMPANLLAAGPDAGIRVWAGGELTEVRRARVWRIDEGA